MERDAKALSSDLSEYMPCVAGSDNWQESVPAALREPAQQIAEATGESFETVVTLVLTFFGAQLRRHSRICDYRGKPVFPELNLLLVRPGRALSMPWYEILCDTLLNRDNNEHALLRIRSPGEIAFINEREHVARESQVLSEVVPNELERKLSPDEVPVVLLHSTANALQDELRRLTRFEKMKLSRVLKQSWNNERIGRGAAAFEAGVSILWDIDADEVSEALSAFYQTTKPSPVLLLDSAANSQKPPVESLTALITIQDDLWLCGQGGIKETALTTEVEQRLLSFVSDFEAEIEHVPSALARRNIAFIPGLCYRLLTLFNIFADPAEKRLVPAATGMAYALARRHFTSLHRFTAGYTAEARPPPDNPAEVLAEYQLLVKIDKHAPITRTKLNSSYSNDNRKRLDSRLARLITDGRVAIDEDGRFSVRSAVSV